MLSTYSVCTAKKTDIRSSDRKSKASFGQMSGRRFTFFLVWPVGRIRSGWRGSAVGSVECWWGGWMETGASKGRIRPFPSFFCGRLFGLRPHALPQDYGWGLDWGTCPMRRKVRKNTQYFRKNNPYFRKFYPYFRKNSQYFSFFKRTDCFFMCALCGWCDARRQQPTGETAVFLACFSVTGFSCNCRWPIPMPLRYR